MLTPDAFSMCIKCQLLEDVCLVLSQYEVPAEQPTGYNSFELLNCLHSELQQGLSLLVVRVCPSHQPLNLQTSDLITPSRIRALYCSAPHVTQTGTRQQTALIVRLACHLLSLRTTNLSLLSAFPVCDFTDNAHTRTKSPCLS